MNAIPSTVQARIAEDLQYSGLTIEDMNIRELDNPARAATHSGHSDQGYIIPYYQINGAPAAFYRVRFFDADPKYKQPKDSPSHIYFPKGFLEVAKDKPYVIFTEGEKKATRAVKAGYPCVAVGGVDSWRNRLYTLPKDTEMDSNKKGVQAKLPSGAELEENYLSPLAMGMQDLIDYVLAEGKHLIICYDFDPKSVTASKVQAAAAVFGYELRFRGLAYNRIRQIRLPGISGVDKVGLDDFLELSPEGAFGKLIETCLDKPSAFPRHPNVRDYLNKRLQKTKMSRKELQQVAMAVLSELDANGMRLKNIQEESAYYFDQSAHRLMKVNFDMRPNELTGDTFGQFLYRQFGIGAGDNRLLQWIGTQFTGEEPVEEVNPYRVFARTNYAEDAVHYQINDGQYIKITGTSEPGSPTPGFRVHNNGEGNILFQGDQVAPLDPDKLTAEYRKRATEPVNFWWGDVLNEVRLVDKNKQRVLTGLLFYVAPWLWRWRGTQLPIEMTLGEAGSGKSTLQALRLNIINGRPILRNAPSDVRDWTASIANTGDLHIIDNLQLLDKNLRQRLSDEYCRLITEPEPFVEARKLYTDNTLIRIPARCQFGITAIKQPFLNSDILARSIIIELDKSIDMVDGTLSYDAVWEKTQLGRYGGREAWVSHHLYVLHKFFELVRREWNHRYHAKHRLINLEQALIMMARVFGMKEAEVWLPDYLSKAIMAATIGADWALEGLIAFAANFKKTTGGKGMFTVADVSGWAMGEDDYSNCEELTNTRRCGRYMQTHKTILQSEAHIYESGKENNRIRYKLA